MWQELHTDQDEQKLIYPDQFMDGEVQGKKLIAQGSRPSKRQSWDLDPGDQLREALCSHVSEWLALKYFPFIPNLHSHLLPP